MQASTAALNLRFVTFYHFLLSHKNGRYAYNQFLEGGEEVVDGVHNSEVCLKWGGGG